MSRRLTSTVIGVTLCGFLVSAAAQASGPVNLYNGGDLHESVGQTDEQPMSSGKPYTARTFPLSVTVRAPDALWGGVQLQSGKFRFIQFHHQKVGKVPLHGWGFVTLETSTGPTPSVAATAQKLHSTPLLEAGPLKAIHVAGFSGKAFDATVSGVDPGNRGISLTPFTTPLHCGFCEDTLHGEALTTSSLVTVSSSGSWSSEYAARAWSFTSSRRSATRPRASVLRQRHFRRSFRSPRNCLRP